MLAYNVIVHGVDCGLAYNYDIRKCNIATRILACLANTAICHASEVIIAELTSVAAEGLSTF